MSGGTRCNLTQSTDARGIVEAFGRPGKFLHSALACLGPEKVVEFFHQAGVPTKVESTGKIFPASDRAIDVRNALLREVESHPSIELKTGVAVSGIRQAEGGFSVRHGQRETIAKSVILTTGGKSYPGCGTVGEGYRWAEEFGHHIVPPVPALTPIVTPQQWVKELSGITVPSVNFGVFEEDRISRLSDGNFKKLAVSSARGSLLFTHFGFSGPAALNVSREISRCQSPSLKIVIDFLPGIRSQDLHAELTLQENVRKQARTLFQDRLPDRLAQSLVSLAGLERGQNLAETGRAQKESLVEKIKHCVVDVEGTRGFKKAEVTAGGVCLKEVNSQTLESKLCRGLFFAGEILDLDGPIGGYNFQAAFSTGYLAGLHA